jgi:hypothetical protein
MMRHNIVWAVLAACSVTLPVWADILHFNNGQQLSGKVSRMTGELIEFKRKDSATSIFNPMAEMIKRADLKNRHDAVEMRNHQTYIGEILYMDAFSVEIRTNTGNIKLPRLRVREISLGIPEASTVNPVDPNVKGFQPKQAEATGMIPISDRPVVRFPGSANEEAPAVMNQRIQKPLE